MFRAVTVGLVILATSLTLMAATVNKIVIKSNTAQNVSPDVVRAHILLVEGAAFSQEQLSKDIKSLYKTGQFDDVVAKAKQAQGDTIDVVFTITPKARINTIVLQGNEAFATKRLMKQLEQETNLPMDETQLSADLEALYAFYRGKGYNNINIEQKIETLEDTGQRLAASTSSGIPFFRIASCAPRWTPKFPGWDSCCRWDTTTNLISIVIRMRSPRLTWTQAI